MGKTRKHRPNEWEDGPQEPKRVFHDAKPHKLIRGAVAAPREDAITPIPARKMRPGTSGGNGR